MMNDELKWERIFFNSFAACEMFKCEEVWRAKYENGHLLKFITANSLDDIRQQIVFIPIR